MSEPLTRVAFNINLGFLVHPHIDSMILSIMLMWVAKRS
jgi:hypothetical protein